MIRGVIILGLFAAVVGAYWLWERENYPVSRVHYRLDVTFVVDGQEVTGSGVQLLVVHRVSGLGQKRAIWSTSGEAVAIELPGGQTVYALMTTQKPDGTYTGGIGSYQVLVSEACKLKERRGDRNWAEYVRFVGSITGACEVPRAISPIMVAFADETDPTSVKRVLPDAQEKVLGPGVQYKGTSLNFTDDTVSTGIDKWLPWLSEYPSRLVESGPPSSEPPFAQTIKHGYFRRFQQ